jgi:hypothetical protein
MNTTHSYQKLYTVNENLLQISKSKTVDNTIDEIINNGIPNLVNVVPSSKNENKSDKRLGELKDITKNIVITTIKKYNYSIIKKKPCTKICINCNKCLSFYTYKTAYNRVAGWF